MNILKHVSLFLLTFFQLFAFSQTKNTDTVKNVIILIPDGTSSSLVTLSRWYNKNNPLTIDPLLCGMIKTHNSNGRLSDSAPAATAYASGVKTKSPYIGIDSNINPRISVLELARLKGMSTGIVATSEFPHATPAGFVCHHNSRESNDYKNLITQFIYNSPTLVFAGGKKYLEESGCYPLLKPNRINLITEKTDFDSIYELPQTAKSLWALFSNWQDSTRHKSYECDRDFSKEPGLSEMTDKAIKLLSKNGKGFFLMVESSQIDWAAHNNDPYAAVTDFLEFDKAVAVALDFAKKDKNTVVIVCPDHGTGGISIGNSHLETAFSEKNKIKTTDIDIYEKVIKPLSKIKYSGRKLAKMMLNDSTYISKDSIAKYYNFNTTDSFITILKDITKHSQNADTIQYLLGRNFSFENYIGWTTTEHTGEDVFLAIYAPDRIKKKTGIIDNNEIGKYIAEILNLGKLDYASDYYFCKHTDLFDDAIVEPNYLSIERNGRKLVIYPNTNILKINETIMVNMNTIAIHLNGYYYISSSILRYLL